MVTMTLRKDNMILNMTRMSLDRLFKDGHNVWSCTVINLTREGKVIRIGYDKQNV